MAIVTQSLADVFEQYKERLPQGAQIALSKNVQAIKYGQGQQASMQQANNMFGSAQIEQARSTHFVDAQTEYANYLQQQKLAQGLGFIQGAGVNAGSAGNLFAKQNPMPRVDLNTLPAMQLGLREAYDLWVVKWGDLWVSREDLRRVEGTFDWSRVADRLLDVEKMEFQNTEIAWRIIPLDVWK